MLVDGVECELCIEVITDKRRLRIKDSSYCCLEMLHLLLGYVARWL